MSFFKELAALGAPMNYAISITVMSEEKMKVTIRVVPTGITGKGANSLIPLRFDGTPAEFDTDLALYLKSPVQKTGEFFANCAAYEKALTAATKKEDDERKQKLKSKGQNDQTQTQVSKPVTPPVNRELEAKQRKFDGAMFKVSNLQQQGKIGQALGALPDNKDFPEFKDKIEAKNKELRRLHGGLSLFEDQEPESGKANTPAALIPANNEEPANPDILEQPGEPNEEIEPQDNPESQEGVVVQPEDEPSEEGNSHQQDLFAA